MTEALEPTFHAVGWGDVAWWGSRALILGAGQAAFAAVDTLMELGSEVLVIADEVDSDLLPLFEVLNTDLLIGHAEDEQLEALREFDPEFAIISPGFPRTSRLVKGLELRRNPVWSDTELAWRLRDKFKNPANWITLTGSRAETITNRAMSVLHTFDVPTRKFGAGHQSVLDGIRDPEQPEFFFVLQNANQLSSLYSAEPKISLYSDSIGDSWHEEEFQRIAALGNVYQHTEMFALYPEQDEYGVFLLERADVIEGCRAIGYSVASPQMSQIGIVEDFVVDRAFIEDRKERALELYTVNEMMDTGIDTVEEVQTFLAVSTLLRAIGLSQESLYSGLFSKN